MAGPRLVDNLAGDGSLAGILRKKRQAIENDEDLTGEAGDTVVGGPTWHSLSVDGATGNSKETHDEDSIRKKPDLKD
jgi:hypothetical protein